MTITYFNLNGGDSDQWCTQFGVGWMIWTFPQSCLFITDAFWIWYLQSWLAVVTHLTAILKNHIYYSELKHYCEYMHLYILIWFIGLFFSLSEDHLHLSPYLSYVSGALAGCAATIGSYPFDLLRTILASQGEPKVSLILPLVYITVIFFEHLWRV